MLLEYFKEVKVVPESKMTPSFSFILKNIVELVSTNKILM